MFKYFKMDEFKCKCGCGSNQISTELIDLLDIARGIAGVPFIITSGYRCPTHNKKVGGVSDSSHIKGLAVDISLAKHKSEIIKACGLVFNRIGIADNFIHVDIDFTKPCPAMWNYSRKTNYR